MTHFQLHSEAMGRATAENRPYTYICKDGTRIAKNWSEHAMFVSEIPTSLWRKVGEAA